MKAGVIGLGDMGSGPAKNLIGAGFETAGFDLDPGRMAAFADIGGRRVCDGDERGAGAFGHPGRRPGLDHAAGLASSC